MSQDTIEYVQKQCLKHNKRWFKSKARDTRAIKDGRRCIWRRMCHRLNGWRFGL